MASSVSALNVKTFELIVRQLAQQSDTRLRPWVQERNEKAATRNWPRLAKRSMAAKASPTAATPVNNAVFTNRVSVVSPFSDGDAVGKDEIAQVLVDPTSNIATSMAYACRRKVDEIIITAAGANALDEQGNASAFPPGQIVGDYTAEIDFPTVTLVNEMFLAKDIPADEPKLMVVGPQQARKLLHIAQATQTWYVEAKQLVEGGFIRHWMGFDWIVSNLLTQPLAGQRQCFAFTRKAIGLQVAEDIWTRIAEDPSISFSWRIYAELTMGAVRVEDEHIVQLQMKDTTTVT